MMLFGDFSRSTRAAPAASPPDEAPAARPALATVGPPIETLDSYIATSLQALDEAGVLKPGPRPPPTAALAAFDELCVRMVEEVSAQIEARSFIR